MFLLIWILVGALSGWIASKIMDTDQSMGAVANIIVGMIGSLIGGTLWTIITTGTFSIDNAFTGPNLASVALSVLGAVVLIWVVKYFKK